jgi:hypothetical protein
MAGVMSSRGHRWRDLSEAGAAVLIASAAIRLLPFRVLCRSMRGNLGAAPAGTTEIAQIRRAINAWAGRLPWRTLCFEKGLSAHMMLRRRRRASTLYYGAATIDGELKAHVWVKSGERDVVGCEIADDYALLARFPDEPPVSAGSHS